MKKKLLSILLCLCMVVALLPTVALAADATETADFAANAPAALALLNENKTGAADSTWTGREGAYVLTLNGVNFTTTAAKAIMSVDLDGSGNGAATEYTDFAEGWNAAVGSGNTANTTVKLLANWTAADGSFGTGAGFGNGTTANSGCIRVPSDKTITLDLNGKNIDRKLTSPVNGSGDANAATGGWVIGDFGTLTIKDSSTATVAAQGKITGGYNSYGTFSAGGIFVGGSGSLTINGGNITGNKALNWGGGVYGLADSTVTMTGGKISRNYANYDNDDGDGGAGGVFTNSRFIMTGGEISENYACGSGSVGGGVYLFNTGSMTVGGTAVVKNNIAGATFDETSGSAAGGNANNVYTNGKTIACSTTQALETGAYIGVTTSTAPAASAAITGNNGSHDYSTYFHSDNASYGIVNNAANTSAQKVMLVLKTTVSTKAIAGVTAPVAGAAPVTAITECSQYTGTVSWLPAVSSTFAINTVYTATITLTPKAGYKLEGVAENYFTVAGARSVSNDADSGVITAVFPATAAAPPVTKYSIYVGGIEVTSANADNITGDGITGTVSYDPTTKTLTLNNATIDGAHENTSIETSYSQLNINLVGENTINCLASENGNSFGIFGMDITIGGTGKLTVNGGAAKYTSVGISGSNIIINSGTVITSGGATSGSMGGAKSSSGGIAGIDITINGGTVIATGKTVSTAQSGAESSSQGIWAYNTVTINGGTVTATGGAVDEYSYSQGISANSGITITDGTVTASSGAAGTSQAMSSAPDLSGYADYQWRTASDGAYATTAYAYDASHTYVQLMSTRRTHSITVSTDGTGSGSVTNNGAPVSGDCAVVESTTPKFLFIPAAGSKLDGLRIDGSPATAAYDMDLNSYYYQFDRVTDDHSLLVTFTRTSSDSGSSGSDDSYYTIKATAGANGIISPSGSVSVRKGLNKTYTITPNAGYAIADVLVDGKSVSAVKSYTFKDVDKAHTISATFEKIPAEAPWVNPFTDVAEGSAFYDAIRYANQNGLFTGTGANTFSPNAPMTRAMLWTVLGRLDGQTLTGSGVFDRAKVWATEKGITDGSNPTGQITREQLVTILWRYAGSPMLADYPGLAQYSDAGDIASYAQQAMAWAHQKGIISGTSATTLNPTGTATRAQVAAIVMRYAQSAAK